MSTIKPSGALQLGPIDTSLKEPPITLKNIEDYMNDIDDNAKKFVALIGNELNIKLGGEQEKELLKDINKYWEFLMSKVQDEAIGSMEMDNDENPAKTKEQLRNLLPSLMKITNDRISEIDSGDAKKEGMVGGEIYPCSQAGVLLWLAIIFGYGFFEKVTSEFWFGPLLNGLIRTCLSFLWTQFGIMLSDLVRGRYVLAWGRFLDLLMILFPPLATNTTGYGLGSAALAEATLTTYRTGFSDSYLGMIIMFGIWLFRLLCNALGRDFYTTQIESQGVVTKAINDTTISFTIRGTTADYHLQELIDMYFKGFGTGANKALTAEEEELVQGAQQDLSVKIQSEILKEANLGDARIKERVETYEASKDKMIATAKRIAMATKRFTRGGGKRSRRRMYKSKRGNKRGGRSRMRKMRTKKRRMSRRKIRR
jgi:hypothetical protein